MAIPPKKNRPAPSSPPAHPQPGRQQRTAPPQAPKAPAPQLPIPSARVTRRASESLRSGHLWVYATDIEQVATKKETDPPALIPVVDNRGIPLGTALYSPNSQITLRLVSREIIDEAAWLQLLAARLQTAIARRQPLLDADNDACRLVFSEADDLPGLIVDKYAGIVVLQLLAKGLDNPQTRAVCIESLSKSLQDTTLTIWERPDPRIRQLEGLSAPSTEPLYHRAGRSGEAPASSTIFHLNGLSFHFDATSGQKTGAFLDQRQNYAAAAAWAQSHGAKRALDVCTYQGGFALHLARVCSHVTAVDASRSSLEVAERNLALNREQGQLPESIESVSTEIDWIEADAFDLLRDWSSHAPSAAESQSKASEGEQPSERLKGGEPWDVIVLDPPAFAKSKRAVEGALRGYKELNLRALRLLKPGGLLITCSCSHHVSLADLESTVAAAALDAHRRVTLLERRGAALDHPVLLNLPETEYLKCLILSVD